MTGDGAERINKQHNDTNKFNEGQYIDRENKTTAGTNIMTPPCRNNQEINNFDSDNWFDLHEII